MRRPVLLLDCDGVLADFVGGYLEAVRQVTGIRYTRERIRTWDLDEHVMLHDDERESVMALTRARGFCLGLSVLPGAVEGVAALADATDLYVVTVPWPGAYWMGERAQWLQDLIGISPARVIQTPAKHLIAGDILVDDRAATLRHWRDERGGLPLLWDTPHNRLDEDLERVSGWPALLARVEEWSRVEVPAGAPCADQVDGDAAAVAAVARGRGGAA